MDLAQIKAAFQASLGNSNEMRNEAHNFLESIKSSPGLIGSLLTLSMSEEEPIELRQISVIYLKNLTKVWVDKKRDFSIPHEDKQLLKVNILRCLKFSTPEKLRSQFQEIAHNIALHDFPWDEILAQLDTALDSANMDDVYAALVMIYQTAKVYEFIMSDRRKNLKVLIQRYFGKLEILLSKLLQGTDEHAHKFVNLIMQTYWVSTYIEISEELRTREKLTNWYTMFKFILDQETTYTPMEYGEINHDAKWQPKRWAVQIFQRFFTRYFNLEHMQEHHKDIGRFYQTEWALPVLQSVLVQLLAPGYKPEILANYFIKYVNQSIKLKATADLVNPIGFKLITEIIMPYLQKVPVDEEIWRENPIEFIRKESDLTQAYYHPKHSSIDLLINLCNKGYLDMFMEYLSQQLNSNANMVEKEALLLAVGSLSLVLQKSEKYSPQIQDLLKNYVLPDFESQVGFLRARACWTYAQFAKFSFDDPSHQSLALSKICSLTIDPELPVKVEAATSLPKILVWPNSKERIASEVQYLLKIYLEIMNQIDCVEVVDALEEIIGKFGAEIIPFAIEFSQHLVQAFLRMSGQNTEQDEGESAMAAASTLNALSNIIDALETREEDLCSVSVLLQPVFEYCLSKVGCEYFEETVGMLTSLLFYSPAGKLPHLFPLINLIQEGVKSYGNEHIEETCSLIGNLCQKYSDLTIQHWSVFSSLFDTLLVGEKPIDMSVALKYIVMAIENLDSIRDSLVQVYMAKALQLLQVPRILSIKNGCYQVIALCLGYAPLLSLQILQQVPNYDAIIREFANGVGYLKENLSTKYVIFAFGGLISIASSLPEFALQVVPQMFTHAINLTAKLRETEVENKVDSKLLESLLESDDEEDYDDEDDLGIFSENQELYESPFDQLSGSEMLKQSVRKSAQTYPEFSQRLLGSLDQQRNTFILTLLDN